jgi:hypothetical protein
MVHIHCQKVHTYTVRLYSALPHGNWCGLPRAHGGPLYRKVGNLSWRLKNDIRDLIIFLFSRRGFPTALIFTATVSLVAFRAALAAASGVHQVAPAETVDRIRPASSTG